MTNKTSSSQPAARSSKNHKIQWLNFPGYKGVTWNPIIGCSKVSEGCRNCYALRMAKRIAGMERTSGKINYRATLMPDKNNIQNEWNGFTFMVEEQLVKPASWKKPRIVFVCSMGDLFHENTPFENIDAVFSVMSDCDHHIYIVLTKRAERMKQFFDWKKKQHGIPWQPSDNVWMGVSAENQEQANKRIPLLLQVPAAVRIVSIEPMLGPVDLNRIPAKYWGEEYYKGFEGINLGALDGGKNTTTPWHLSWVITGGESGPKARPMHPDWVRSIRDQCKAAGVPFFFKQWGEWYTKWEDITTGKPVHKMFTSFLQWQQKMWVNKGDACISIDGTWCKTGGDLKVAKYPVAIMQKVGRKAAGNLLDGEKWEEYPATTPSITSSTSAPQVSPPGQEGSGLDGAKAGVVDNKLNN